GDTVLSENRYTYNVYGEVVEKSTAEGGDLAKLTTVSMDYDAANRLTSYNGEKVIYDEKGNMLYGPVDGVMQELTYDCRNRLIEAGGVSYTYDAENTRIATTKDGRTTEYVTDTGGSLSRLLTAYEADGTTTEYYYGAEGLSAQYNDGTKEYLNYHYDNIGSTTMLTDITGKVMERFAYGTYGELLSDVKNSIRFLYNGAYGVTTDENGLYYMRARYYNSDIKRFINQDIKVGDIGNSQGLNRYAYCEGNPVNMADPFGLCGEDTQDQGKKSKYEFWHNVLDVAGLFFDGADIINAAIYAYEKDWTNAALCAASAIPAVGAAIAGVAKGAKAIIKAKKAEKIASLAAEASRMTRKAADTLDTFSDTMRVAQKYGKGAVKSADNIISDVGSKVMKAMETGGDLGKEASKAVKSAESAVSAGGLKLSTKVDDAADMLKTADAAGVGGCFVAGTKVKTEDGEKNIEDVETGDYVLAENPETGEQEYKEVVRTFIHVKYVLVHVTVGEEEIETTLEHPFYVEGIGFVSAGELKAGDAIRTSDGKNLPILKVEIEKLEEPVLVYNFEVEDFHTYYVSELGVLVHNMCMVRPSKSGSGSVKTDFYVTKDGTVIPANKVKQNSQYNRIEIEIKSGKAVRPQNALDDWDDFLGPNQTDIDPFTGKKSKDRIWSEDGKRSIRFGEHEMESMGTARFHYHKETWYDGYVINELQRIQKR
ncbi:MAG: polymorphic toxin-type HINT domain-containing protein, partial [Clostridiales bacterium]|nr:polymorphic toxin-type HINT domain-containing protein [Clostridiales bacterium]